MEIGKLNRRVEILKFIKTRDAYGGVDGDWRAVDRVWAHIEPVNGTEYFGAQQVTAETTTKIKVRFNPRLTTLHRIRYGDKVYEIIGIGDAKTEHQEMILNCKEMINDELQRKTAESESKCRGCEIACQDAQSDG